jgi:epoxyqueuosine reductase QueG
MGEMNDLTKEIKAKALELGFKAVGVTSSDRLRGLPRGWVADVKDLQSPEEILPGTRSVIMLVLHAWDKAFFMQIDSPLWKGYRLHTPEENIEGYYIVYQISQAKAWPLAWFLRERGFNAVVTESIPMKATAIQCGLGHQGKNTLFLHPKLGPRIGLMAILTDAKLVADAPFKGDLCGDCERCIKACPSGALKPYNIEINRCMAYASENPGGTQVSPEARALAEKYTTTPSKCSYLECTICMDACPIGKDIKDLLRGSDNVYSQ